MKPHRAAEVSLEDWKLFEEIKTVIEAMPEELTGSAFLFGAKVSRRLAETTFIPNCHMMTRALSRNFPVDVHDGAIIEMRNDCKYSHEHSWLTRRGGSGDVIIDPWPLGSLSGPMLTIQGYCFWYGNECSYLEHRSLEFQSRVATTARIIRNLLGSPEFRAA